MSRPAYQAEIRSGRCAECERPLARGPYCHECRFRLDRLREFGEAAAAERWAALLDAYELPETFRETWLGPAIPLTVRGERLVVAVPRRQRRWIERRLGAAFAAAGVEIVSPRRGVEELRQSRGLAGSSRPNISATLRRSE